MRIRHLSASILTIILLASLSVSVCGNVYNTYHSQAVPISAETPRVILQQGITGTSTIYTNSTSARVYVAPNWLTGWSYRKSHLINYAAGAGTLYQTQVIVHYGSGTDNGADVYLNSHSRTDFGDVRFTDDDGSTLLDYWMESKVDGVNATFWVEVANDLSTVNQTIYVYYGKSDAMTTSNGANTFLFFDDFDDNDISDWTQVTGTWTVASGIVSEDTSVAGRIKKDFSDSGGRAYEINIRGTESGDYAWAGLEIKSPNENYGKYDQGYLVLIYTPTMNRVKIFRVDAGVPTLLADNAYTFELNVWYKIKVTYYNNVIKTFVNDSLVNSATDSTYPTGEVIRIFNDDNSLNHDFDDVRIRKFVDPEPSHGSWGSEESGQTFDHVLEVANQVGDAWKIRLRAYDQSNIGRLSNCTIYFYNGGGVSRQIYILNGAYSQQFGNWYDLTGLSTVYIAMTVSATSTGTSYVYAYLEVLVPDTSTYNLMIITFEVS